MKNKLYSIKLSSEKEGWDLKKFIIDNDIPGGNFWNFNSVNVKYDFTIENGFKCNTEGQGQEVVNLEQFKKLFIKNEIIDNYSIF